MVKKRWKGLCALWIVLALVIGTFPVAGAVEDVPESAAAAVSEDAGDDESQVLEESGSIENSLEEKPETDSSETGNMESAEKENAESLTENEGTAGSSAGEGTAGSLAENEGTGESSAEKEGATGSSVEEEGIAESSAGKEEAMGDSTKDETGTAPGQSVESRTDEGTEETALKEGEKESGKSEESGSVEEASAEESSAKESPSRENNKKEILETTAPAFTAPEQPQRTAFSARAAAAREVVATSANAWLYVGSDEVRANETYLGDAESASLYRQQVTVQFDVSFDSQDGMGDITIPADKKLNGWNLWGFNGSGYVTEDLGELELTGQLSADEYQSFNIDNIYSFLLIEPLWRNARDIQDGDSLVMNIGDSCNLSEGTWQVSGDTTMYTVDTGGSTVYAARSGTFIFSNNLSP